MPSLNAKKAGIIAAVLAAHTLILSFYFHEAQQCNTVISAEKNKLRAEAKEFESYLRQTYSEGRSAESKKLLGSKGDNPVFANFLKVLDSDPQSLAVVSDNSRASAAAAKFYESREPEMEKRLAPVRARQRNAGFLAVGISLVLLTVMAFLVVSQK